MSGRFSQTTARNVFYGGSAFFILLLLALTFDTSRALPERDNRHNLTEQVALEPHEVVPKFIQLDGNTTPRDLRLDRLLARKAEDFVGRRALERPGLVDPSRPRLVGLVSEDGQRIGAGAQLVTNPAAPKPLRTLGHVTSACLSPTLGRPIALALLTDGDARRGELLCAAAPVAGLHTRVRVTDPVFVDPKGRRPRG